MELLHDRGGPSLVEYLKTHPELESISRDRANVFADAATKGAPNAQQIVDRWHLLRNLREMLQQVFLVHPALLNEVAHGVEVEASAPGPRAAGPPDEEAEKMVRYG